MSRKTRQKRANMLEKFMYGKSEKAVEAAGDALVDLYVWRLGLGHCGAVISVVSQVAQRGPAFYHALLRRFKALSHITVEIHTPLAG